MENFIKSCENKCFFDESQNSSKSLRFMLISLINGVILFW